MHYSPILLLHISAGMLGMLSGAVALCFRKGSVGHAVAGKVFVVSMLTMAASAVYLAFFKHQPNNIGGGVLTFYLITTAWLTAKRRNGQTSAFDWVVLLVPLVAGIGGWINGFDALHSLDGAKYGVPAGMHFFMGSVMLLAAAGDIRMLMCGGVVGRERIVRHLWRMCFGLFIATGSFFTGQGSKMFPGLLRQSNLLLIPAVLPLVLLVLWFLRVRFASSYKKYGTKLGPDVTGAPSLGA